MLWSPWVKAHKCDAPLPLPGLPFFELECSVHTVTRVFFILAFLFSFTTPQYFAGVARELLPLPIRLRSL
jgi:hypothetical protein